MWDFEWRAWARKHRRALWVAAGVTVAGFGSYYFLSSRAKTSRDKIAQAALLRKESEDRAEAQLQSHFESIQRISDSTTLPSVLPQLKERLYELVNLSSLTEQLMSAKEDRQALSSRDKLNLWQELKVLSFTRTVSAMWSVSLLGLFIRTQLNILGRHVYIHTAWDMSTSKKGEAQKEQYKPLSMSCQHKFIALASFLPQKGVDGLVSDVHAAVDAVLRSKPLQDPCTVSDLREVFEKIRQCFHENLGSWVQYVLPANRSLPKASEEDQILMDESCDPEDAEKLEQLMLETRTILSSYEFTEVLAAALDAVLDGVLEDLSTIYRGNTDLGIPLAKLLPPVACTGNTLMEHPDGNRYIQILARLPQVKSFCALVYAASTEGEDVI